MSPFENIILLFLLLIDFFISCYSGYVDRSFNAKIALKLYNQISKIDYEFYENPDLLADTLTSMRIALQLAVKKYNAIGLIWP